MVTRFRTYCRTVLAGALVFAGVMVVSVIGGPQPALPASATPPSAWTAYVVSYTNDAVIPINTATDALGAPITVGSGPSAIAITPDATTAYVTDEGTTNTAPGFVTPIDLLTNTPGTPIPVGSGPDAIAITPNGLTAYVGNYNDDTVTPINLATNTPGTPIPVGAAPTAISISPDGSTAYVTQAYADDDIPINTATNKAGAGILNTYNGFASAITPDGSTLYTPDFTYNGVATLDPATDARGSIAALDDPEGVAITPDGATAYVTYANTFAPSGDQASLLPIDTATGTAGNTDRPGHQCGRRHRHHPRRRHCLRDRPTERHRHPGGTVIGHGRHPDLARDERDQSGGHRHHTRPSASRSSQRHPGAQRFALDLRRIRVDRGLRDHRLLQVELR